MEIKSCQPTQAQAYLELCAQIDAQTPYMMLEAGERALQAPDLQAGLTTMLSNDDQRIFLAWEAVRPMAYINISRKPFNRVQHVFYLVLGVLRSHWGRGIGTALLEHAEDWAVSVGGTRLELNVMEHNQRAITLYQRLGFTQEGCRKNSMWVSGEYVNELYMAKLCGAGV
nr:GNAT family N-acetyltransferase [Oceanococcus sp. HetDA_MAG_MS8]